MNNLWNQREDIRKKLITFFDELANLLKNKDYQVVFVTQGKNVLKKYPENWWVYDSVDQVEILSRSDVFVTHGGSNSFHEAVIQKVPMIVIPFFGDQLLVANQTENLGLGIMVGGSKSIDTHNTGKFLNKQLAKNIVKSIDSILLSDKYIKNYIHLNQKAYSIRDLILKDNFTENNTIQEKISYEEELRIKEWLRVFPKLDRFELIVSLFGVDILIDSDNKIPQELFRIFDDAVYFRDGVEFYKKIQNKLIPVDFDEVKTLVGVKGTTKSILKNKFFTVSLLMLDGLS
jgi:hypothetical protein